jgi:hypothetical protein
MPFGPRLKSIDCADMRQIPQRTCRKKGRMRLSNGLMISPNQRRIPERNRRCCGLFGPAIRLQYGNNLKSIDPYLAASIKDANHIRKMGARHPHSANPLITQA